MVDVFPSHQQNQIRMQLAQTLLGIVSQRLVNRVTAAGCRPSKFCTIITPYPILSGKGKTHQIDLVIQTSREKGMIPLNQSLADLVKRGIVFIRRSGSLFNE